MGSRYGVARKGVWYESLAMESGVAHQVGIGQASRVLGTRHVTYAWCTNNQTVSPTACINEISPTPRSWIDPAYPTCRVGCRVNP